VKADAELVMFGVFVFERLKFDELKRNPP
jgi:hypothetical protein